jgi:hypothetical protein
MKDFQLPGTRAHATDTEIEQFRRRTMEPEALVSFTDHVDACRSCRDRLAAGIQPRPIIEGLEELTDHVGEDEVQAYVKGGLAPQRIQTIESHLNRCVLCRAEIADLRGFATARPARRTRTSLIALVAAAAVLFFAVGAFRAFRSTPAPPLLTLTDVNGPIRIDATGRLASFGRASLTPQDAQSLRDALTTGTLPIPASIRDLAGVSGVLMGAAESPTLGVVSPVGTAVLSDRPRFRWHAPPGASSAFVITVQDVETKQTFSSAPVPELEWVPDRSLDRGHTYDWQVAASLASGEAVAPAPTDPRATFRVVDRETVDRLAGLPASHAVRTVLYARAGLIEDARREAAALGVLNPGSTVVQRWVRQLGRSGG